MIAIDTNVLVRLLTGDHPAQSKASHTLFGSEDIHFPDTVLLHTECNQRPSFKRTDRLSSGHEASSLTLEHDFR